MSKNELMPIGQFAGTRLNRNLEMTDFALIGKVSTFCHDGKEWHGKLIIGAGGAEIKIDHWGTSPDDVWKNISQKFWSFMDGTTVKA